MVIDDQAVVRQGFVALINTVADMEVIAEGINGQQAIDLLYSGAALTDEEKLAEELDHKTAGYIDALRRNDLTAVKASLPVNSSSEEAIKRWNDFVQQNGAVEEAEVLGTSSLNQQGVQTFVRLRFRKAAGVYKVTWRQGMLWQQAEDRLQPEITSFLRRSFVDLPLTVRFLPQTAIDLTTYDLVKNRFVSISFPDRYRLVIHAKTGDVIARRIVG